jgi:hypothetical protein
MTASLSVNPSHNIRYLLLLISLLTSINQVTYLPFPLVNLNSGTDLSQQEIYIAPEAFDVISQEFSSFLNEWQQMAGFNFTKVRNNSISSSLPSVGQDY